MTEPSNETAAAIAALTDQEATQVLNQLTIWLIAQRDVPVEAADVLDQITRHAERYRSWRT